MFWVYLGLGVTTLALFAGMAFAMYRWGKADAEKGQAEDVVEDVKKAKRIADRSGAYFDDFIMRERNK